MILHVRQNTIGAQEYMQLCMAVYHEKPLDQWP
jgi:hypothetical protein